MGFKALGSQISSDTLKNEIKTGEKTGLIVLGETCFFFKAGFSKYYIPYSEIKRCYKRIKVLPVRNRKTDEKSLQIEYVVLMDFEKEIAEIQLPGNNAADIILKKVVEKNAEIITVCPRKIQKKNDRNEDNIEL